MAELEEVAAAPEPPWPDEGRLRECVELLVQQADLQTCNVGQLRTRVATECGLAPSGLEGIKDQVNEMVRQAVQSRLSSKAGQPCRNPLELTAEPNNARRAYLVTFSHTDKDRSEDGHRLVPPGTYSRSEIKDFMLGAVASTQSSRMEPLKLVYLSVFQERHASGDIHYHVAVLVEKCFRFNTLKRHFLAAHGLATHWSGKSDGYAGCVAYCYMPSPRKAVEELDPSPELWPSTHPPLLEASRHAITAAKLWEKRESAVRERAAAGKAEGRIREVDLWPIVIKENIGADEVGPERLMAYAKRCGGSALVDYCFANWDKLPSIIAKSWKVEKVENHIETATKTRLDLLHGALSARCTCGGEWPTFAQTVLSQNGHSPAEWCKAVEHVLLHGRSKGNFVCHAGFEGNEGKSFLFRPLPLVFGDEGVFLTPPKSAFPLLGLEKARLVWLDDWRFNEDIISWALQLLWFEGASFIIARPQNLYAGHLKYSKNDPVFLTTLQADLHALKGKLKQGDVDMMVKRLKIYEFKQKVSIPPHVAKGCAACFAHFVLREGQAVQGQCERSKPEATSSGDTPEPKRMLCLFWTVDDVCKYVSDLELGHVAPAFKENAIDGRMLASLSEADMVAELGLKPLQARKVKDRLS